MPTVAIKDPLLNVSDDFLRNPYPYYSELRENAPLYWSESGKYWIVTRFEDADAILRDLRFGKRSPSWAMENNIVGKTAAKFVRTLVGHDPQKTQSMLNANPPDHTRLRGLVNKAFTPKMVEQMRVHIEQIADDLLDKVQAAGRMDLVADFAFPLPVTVIAEMLGVPAKDQETFKSWSNSVTGVLEPGASIPALLCAAVAKRSLESYLRPLIAERRKNPQDDLISVLVQAEEAGNRLTAEELLANVILLLVAGHETTVNLIAGSALGLLTNPEQRQLLENRPELLSNAVEEFLRWVSPVQITRRIATEDIEFGGKTIKSGDWVIVCNGAANHDPEKFPDPDKLDITRGNVKHLAFGIGIHHCLGWAVATAEGQIAVDKLLRRLPNLKLAIEPEQIEWKRPFSLRGPKKLPVTF
ncbi:MAG: cytochrome P450 [Candidatus Obscuribacterales bacterium]|nr:cytochrome P450 [Candidatus Obscuribacterales bacterium]